MAAGGGLYGVGLFLDPFRAGFASEFRSDRLGVSFYASRYRHAIAPAVEDLRCGASAPAIKANRMQQRPLRWSSPRRERADVERHAAGSRQRYTRRYTPHPHRPPHTAFCSR